MRVESPRGEEVIDMGRKGKRYSPRFQFQVVLDVLKGDRDAVEIA